MKVIFFGTPQFSVPTLERLLNRPEFEVLGVVTQPDKRRGRGKKVTPSPVKALAIARNLPVWQPKRLKKDPDTLDRLRQAGADVFVVVAYGQILSTDVLEMPDRGCVNVHGSILPKYRGAAPIQWCLVRGELETGITTMLMDPGMDTGPMLEKVLTPIGLLDNADDLARRLADLGADLLVDTLLKLDRGTLEPVAQDDAQATYAPLIRKDDYRLDWSRPTIELHNRVRGFYPNCTATFREHPLKVIATAPLGAPYWSQLPEDIARLERDWEALSNQTAQPGEVVRVAKKLGAIVQTGDGLLLLRELQLAGKKAQSGWDFANGTRLEAGERFGNG
jgi:methionyl-tRNA formyltransferase